MSFAPKPTTPRLVGTKTANNVDPRLLPASFNGVEFPVSRPLLEQPKPAQTKTK